MPFRDLLDLLLPMLQQKASEAMPNSTEIHQLLDMLVMRAKNYSSGPEARSQDLRSGSDELVYHDGGSAVGSQLSEAASNASSFDNDSRSQVSVGGARWKPGFAGALQVMGARLLLSLISRLSPPEAHEERAIVDKILALLHEGTDPQPDPFKEDDSSFLQPGVLTPSNVSASSGANQSGLHNLAPRRDHHSGASRQLVGANFDHHFVDNARRPQLQRGRMM
jgi:hypothetical protein